MEVVSSERFIRNEYFKICCYEFIKSSFMDYLYMKWNSYDNIKFSKYPNLNFTYSIVGEIRNMADIQSSNSSY